MPLVTSNTPISANDVDDSITVPAIVQKFVQESDLKGLDGALWENFRFRSLLSPAQAKAALLNRTRLSKEELACVLFDIFGELLKRLEFKYSYTANQSLFSTDVAVPGMDLSCMGCTRSLAGLFYSFGFEQRELLMHVSNPTNNDAVKVVSRPTVDPANVQGYQGRSVTVAYDAATMSPTRNEISNGFKLSVLGSGGSAVKMVPRDPFLNHYSLYVSSGLQFPHFDALVGTRYRNGQSDLFAGYQRWQGGDVKYRSELAMAFKQPDNDQSRLYSIPNSLNFDGNMDFLKARQKYTPEGLQLWFVIDPDDWAGGVNVQMQRSRSVQAPPPVFHASGQPAHTPSRALNARIGSASPPVAHPQKICHVFGLV